MANTTDKTVTSKYQPKSTNVIWVDTSLNPPVEKHFINGRWVAVSGGGGGTKKYSDLEDKPTINGVELDGNKTSQDIGVYSKPSSGIPESDLSSDVQQSLQKHFKGWYASSSALPSNPIVGDYAYVKGATSTAPAAIYECTTDGFWSDSGRIADTSNVQTFASGEEVNEVHIVNDLTTGGTEDVLSAEQGKILGTKTDILFNEFVYEVTLQSKFQTIEGETYLSGKGYYGCKNLLKIADVEETVTNGITWHVTDGVIYINGTNNSGGYVILDIPVLQNIEFDAGDNLLYLAFLSKSGSATSSITNVFYMDAQSGHVFTPNPAIPKTNYYYGFTSKEVTVHSTRTTVKGMYIQIDNGVGVTNVTIAPTLSFAADKTAFGDSFVKGTGFTAFDGAVDDDFEEGTFVQGNSPITISKYYIKWKGNDVSNKEIDMYIGSVVDGIPHASNGTIESSNEYVTMDSLVTVPSNNARLRFIIPNGINAYMRYGTYGNSVNQTKSLIKNGDIVQLGYDNIVFRLFFSGDTCENIQTMIDNKELRVLYEDDDVSVCHHDKDALVKSVMYKYTPTRESNGWPTNLIPNLPTFAHVSDLHGDATRLKRCLEYCRAINGVSAVFNSGDICNYTGVNGMTFVKYLRDSILQDTTLINCIGNHDAYSLQTNEAQYNGLMKYDIEEYEPETPDGVTYPTYYYLDLSNDNLRVIVVNQYCSIDGSHTDTSTGYYSESELDFVADALYTCPAGYGVLIVCHSCESVPTSITGHTKFYTTPSFNRSIVYMWDSTGENHAMPLQDLVDAFISKSDFSKTYTHPSITVGGQTVNATSFTIAKDFSNRQITAEFIAYINGHSHCDSIGYAKYTTNTQLYLNITCGVAVYGGTQYAALANCCDIPRGGVGATQDAINIYSIDRDKGVVYVVRVGSDKGIGSDGLFVRDIDAIPYK